MEGKCSKQLVVGDDAYKAIKTIITIYLEELNNS